LRKKQPWPVFREGVLSRDVGAVYAVRASKTVGTKETFISGCSYVDEIFATVLVTADGFLLQHDTRGGMRSTGCASTSYSEKAQPWMP
jgi:hypothetical protein